MNNKIGEFRAKHKLTQHQLAQKVGVRRETINQLERGKFNPSLQLSYKISRALYTTIEDLFIFE